MRTSILLVLVFLSAHAVVATAEPKHQIAIGKIKVDIFDLDLWQKYRNAVCHPATVYKAKDIARAKRNISRHQWARERVKAIERALPNWWPDDDGFFEKMIPATTPGTVLFTMCPHCEYSPAHGQYAWKPTEPEKLTCKKCGTIYPNDKYVEDMVLEATATGPQRFTYYGGKSWHFYGHHIRSSWTGQIRRRKASYMATQAQRFATAYVVTGKAKYAHVVRKILLRLADVYPDYLVHSGYGEYADLPPKVAAVSVNKLPADELTLAPNKPNRKLHPGYWMTGRICPTGMEGVFTASMTITYDLTCEARDKNGTPVYRDAERRHIERNLLLESTYLLMADAAFNNKSVTNRRAAALVGACVGDPMRVRFGLEAFDHMVGKWYLTDGNPSETPAYGHMTLNGIIPMSEGLAGYTDPPGFSAPSGRIEQLDLYRRPAYRAVFRALIETILPDLRYPAWGDSYPHTKLSDRLAEIAAARYSSAQSGATLDRAYGGKLNQRGNEYALFHREPNAGAKPQAFELASTYWPAWKAVYLRIGEKGLDGTAVLIGSDWGGHHHRDALGLSLFWQNHDCLTDLGYLWDSPNGDYTRRTLAHNLVLIDGKDQRTSGRLGTLRLFDVARPFQVAEMSSNAYPNAAAYRRTIVTLPLGRKGYAVVDLFRVLGGKTHELVYHGPNENFTPNATAKPASRKLYDLVEVRTLAQKKITWQVADGVRFMAINVLQPAEKAYIGSGWGSRDRADTRTRVPYVLRRRENLTSDDASCFVTVYILGDFGPDKFDASAVLRSGETTAVMLDTGRATYHVVSQAEPRAQDLRVGSDRLTTDGLLTVHSRSAKQECLYLIGGTSAGIESRLEVRHEPSITGPVVAVRRGEDESHVLIDASVKNPDALRGLTLILKTGSFQTGYPILDARVVENGHLRITTRCSGRGFSPIDGKAAIVHYRSIASSHH